MRYTYFFKLPEEPYTFEEGNDREAFIAKAEAAAEAHPDAVITVCDRETDCMIWAQNEFGYAKGMPCNIKLTGMFL